MKTAEEHVADITRAVRVAAHDKAEFLKKRDQLEFYGDLRDDVISLIKNSGLSFTEIHARCGPVPVTLSKWLDKEVKQPRLEKMQSVLRILGKDLGIIEGRRR